MDNRAAKERVATLRCRSGIIDPEELDEVWAALETVHVTEIIGAWRGLALNTGHRAVGALRELRWYGTRFDSLTEAHPIIRYDPDGHLYSDTEYADGAASLWMVEFRGEVTAAMIYDCVPVLDHFKKVDDTTLLGIMNGKQAACPGGRPSTSCSTAPANRRCESTVRVRTPDCRFRFAAHRAGITRPEQSARADLDYRRLSRRNMTGFRGLSGATPS